MYVFNLERRTSKLTDNFLIGILLRVSTSTELSRLVLFKDINLISAGGSLKSSRYVAAARSSASLAKI